MQSIKIHQIITLKSTYKTSSKASQETMTSNQFSKASETFVSFGKAEFLSDVQWWSQYSYGLGNIGLYSTTWTQKLHFFKTNVYAMWDSYSEGPTTTNCQPGFCFETLYQNSNISCHFPCILPSKNNQPFAIKQQAALTFKYHKWSSLHISAM